ncbi:hypothetical protein [Arthrobacter sp. UYCu712]|uniref:hypothetical protein n=1 Tax=Arthrobacter sp. UYCu712 TaxID=3156340 RepID=UPI0033910198
MVPGWLPGNWRDGRLMYSLQINGPKRWVDLTAAESIADLNRHPGQQLVPLPYQLWLLPGRHGDRE